MTGALWALLAGGGFGLFQSLNRRAIQGMDVYTSTFLQLLLSTVVLAAFSLATEDLSLLRTAPPLALLNFGLAGFFHFFAGWTLLNASQKRIGAARTSPLIGTTPLFGTVIAALLLQEIPGAMALLGVLLTVAGVSLVTKAHPEAEGAIPGDGGTGRTSAAWQGTALGLTTALCWAISPVFIRHGLRGLASPLIGVTVGLAVSAAAYGLALWIRQQRAPAQASREALLFKLAAGILVGLSTWARWVALDLTSVAVVLALASISVPTTILLAPLIAGQHLERVTPRLWVGAMGIVAGSVVLVFYR